MLFRARDVWWPAAGVLAVLLVVGAVLRQPGDPVSSGIGIALGLSSPILLACGLGSEAAGPSVRARLLRHGLIGVGVVGLALDSGINASDISWFGLCVLVLCTTLAAGRLDGGIVWFVAVVVLGESWLFVRDDLGWLPWMLGVTVCLGAGVLVGRDRALLTELRAAQAGLAERSRAEERNRISRDLHDVIAHSLTVSLLHISSARLALEHDPTSDDAVRGLAEAERLGRESLDEVRSIVGLMRDGTHESLAPVLGLEALPELVERFRGAGAEMELQVDGDLARVPATAGTTLVRIAQEALTNAVRHAPGSGVSVGVSIGSDHAELSVFSAGRPGSGQGMGLTTMRERAEALGGTCRAGAWEGGWRVLAGVPIRGGAR